MAVSSASVGRQMASTFSRAVRTTSFPSGLSQNPSSWRVVKVTSLGLQLYASIHGAVMIETIALDQEARTADFCYGISV